MLGGWAEGQQRLVAQQQPRPAGQRLGDPQPLLLPAGQQPDPQAPAVPVHPELDQVPAPDGQVTVEISLLGPAPAGVTGLVAWALYSSTFALRPPITRNICAVSPRPGSLPFSMAAANPGGVTTVSPAAWSR